MTRSLRHRRARRGVVPWVWLQVPVISPYADRLAAAAAYGHLCQPLIALPDGQYVRAYWGTEMKSQAGS